MITKYLGAYMTAVTNLVRSFSRGICAHRYMSESAASLASFFMFSLLATTPSWYLHLPDCASISAFSVSTLMSPPLWWHLRFGTISTQSLQSILLLCSPFILVLPLFLSHQNLTFLQLIRLCLDLVAVNFLCSPSVFRIRNPSWIKSKTYIRSTSICGVIDLCCPEPLNYLLYKLICVTRTFTHYYKKN